MRKPAARIGDQHKCPMTTGDTAHVGGPLLPNGSTNVFIGGKPAARLNDKARCTGSVDMISGGSSKVFINGKPAARVGDPTLHGGIITAGCSSVNFG